jgi:hypothetical protein
MEDGGMMATKKDLSKNFSTSFSLKHKRKSKPRNPNYKN